MINGVLIERTVKDVIPALKTNSDGLKKVLDELLKQYKVKQDEMEKWKVPPPPFGRYWPSHGSLCHLGRGKFVYLADTSGVDRKRTISKLCSNRLPTCRCLVKRTASAMEGCTLYPGLDVSASLRRKGVRTSSLFSLSSTRSSPKSTDARLCIVITCDRIPKRKLGTSASAGTICRPCIRAQHRTALSYLRSRRTRGLHQRA